MKGAWVWCSRRAGEQRLVGLETVLVRLGLGQHRGLLILALVEVRRHPAAGVAVCATKTIKRLRARGEAMRYVAIVSPPQLVKPRQRLSDRLHKLKQPQFMRKSESACRKQAIVHIQSRACTSRVRDTPALPSQNARSEHKTRQGKEECACPIRATSQTPSQGPANAPMHVWSTHQPPATFSSRGRRTLTFSSVCAAAWGRNAAARRAGRNAARAWPCRALCGAASAWPSRAERACIPVVFMLAVCVKWCGCLCVSLCVVSTLLECVSRTGLDCSVS